MKKIVLIAGVIIIVVLLITGVFGKPGSDSKEILKIGAILPLSGDLASIGEEINRGGLIAVDELKEQGIEIQYISEDDEFNPAKSASAAQKLVSINKVDAVFTAVGEEAKPIAGIFNSAKIPLLVAWDSNSDLKKAGDHIFSIGFSSEKNGEKMAQYARTIGLSRVAIVGHVDEVVDILLTSFSDTFKRSGGAITSKYRLQPTETDYRSVITRIKSEATDGVYIALLPPANSLFLKQAQQIGLKAQIMGVDAVQDFEIEEAGLAAEGMLMTNVYAENTGELVSAYKRRYGKEPVNVPHLAFGYDSVIVIVEAIKLARDNNTSIAEALKILKTDKSTSPVDMNGTGFSERVEKIYKIVEGEKIIVN